MYESIRVVQDCKIRVKRCLFLRTKLESSRYVRSLSTKLSSWRMRVTVSTGLHAGRATELTVAAREESLTRTESVARWSREGREACEAEREAPIFVFSFFLF